jgi:hypothetical protein
LQIVLLKTEITLQKEYIYIVRKNKENKMQTMPIPKPIPITRQGDTTDM